MPDIAGENAEFVLEDGNYLCGVEVEKMSKSKFNVVNPDDIVERYGADTLRLYEMFLGPLEQAKPWNTNGIDGTFRFIRKLWRLFYNENGQWIVKDTEPTKDELRVLHKTIKKVQEDIENFSFNTAVSAFMMCVNELGTLKSSKKSILTELVVLLSPYAPHITEELYAALGHEQGRFPWPPSRYGSSSTSSTTCLSTQSRSTEKYGLPSRLRSIRRPPRWRKPYLKTKSCRNGSMAKHPKR